MMSGIEEILRRNMGLEASSIGASTVEKVVRGRMALVGAETTEEYLLRLRHSPGELDELIEAVVVPESWFFRDNTPFTALTSWVREQWQPAHPGETLRVLTVPCSTGEEPYSVTMALLGAGLPPERFTVDAVDISRRALARAQKAVYGQNSFRGQALDFRDRYFAPVPEGYALATEVKRQVRFENGNILAPDFRPGGGRFDVIFCRNLLIYFDRPTQGRAVQALVAMLAPDGLLFVGHAETSIPAGAGCASANYPMSFAFRKAPAAPPVPGVTRTNAAPRVTLRMPSHFAPPSTRLVGVSKAPGTRPLPFFMPRPLAPEVPLPDAAPQPLAPSAKPAFLDAARALADQGKLDAASRLCEDHLRQNGACAAGWYLLGVVRDAAGDRGRAAECYAKTLYLEPDHQDALLQRALLAEQNGDTATAEQLRRRIVRVQKRTTRL